MVKAYCGCGDVPKGQKLGNLKECTDAGQVRLYGLKKLKKVVLQKMKKEKEVKKVKIYTENDLFIIMSELSGVKTKLDRIIENSKNEDEIKKAKEILKNVRDEYTKYYNIYKKVKGGEKIPIEKRKKIKLLKNILNMK